MSMKKAVWGFAWLCISAGIFSAGTIFAQAISAGPLTTEAVTTKAVTTKAVSAEAVSAEAVTAQEVSAQEVSAPTLTEETLTEETLTEGTLTEGTLTEGTVTEGTVTDRTVTDRTVTDRQVPASVVALPHNRYAVLVEKQTQQVYVYRSGPDARNLVPVFEAASSTGEMPGPKQVEGDKKTPEGIYFVLEVFEEKYLTPVYGSRALTTDYPNFFDQRQGKTGYAIWIHGTDKPLKPMDTNGCVALENPDVAALARYVTPHVTPVIIQEKIQTIAPEDLAQKRHVVSAFVADWVQAQLTGTFSEYQAFYAPSYLPDGPEWEDWDALRRSLGPSLEPLEIQISELGIFAHDDTRVVVMEFVLVLGAKIRDLGRRKLFVQHDEADRLQIVGDLFQVPDNAPKRSLAVLAEGVRSLGRPLYRQEALIYD